MTDLAAHEHITRQARIPDHLRLAECGLVLAGLLVATGAFRTALAAGADDREAGSIAFQLVTLSIYGAAAMFLLRGIPRWAPKLMLLAAPVLLLTLLAFLSTQWSDSSATTFRRSVALLLTTGFALYVVMRFEARPFMQILAAAFICFFLVSIAAIALPGVGITPSGTHAGAWRGMTGQKNEFGRTCGLALTYFTILILIAYPNTRKKLVLAASVALGLLLLSTSKTPIAATVVGLGGTAINLLLLRGRIGPIRLGAFVRVILLIAIVATIAVAIVWLVPLVVAAMGRDLTFSGRTQLWSWAIGVAGDTPWFGSGYGGFWNDRNTRYFFEYFAWQRSLDGELSDSYTGPTHAHSGYVDLWLELGWVGIGLLALSIGSAFVKISWCFRAGRVDLALCLSAVTWFLVAYAFTARSFMQQTQDLWFLFLVFYFYAARAQAEATYRARRRWSENDSKLHDGQVDVVLERSV